MKNKTKFLLFTIGVIICSLLFVFIQVYAKYLSSATSNTELTVSRWNILVNNTSIQHNTDISQNIIPVFPGNDHIASNVIAPTAEGYFDLDFDFSAVDVSFNYQIETLVSDDSLVKDIVTTGYSVDDGEKITFENYNESITSIVPLNTENRTRKLRIYIMWNDDSENGATMDNAADTLSTKTDNPVILKVKITFNQILENQETP